MRKYPFLLLLVLAGCIGTDEVDDPIVGESIVLDQEQISLLIGNSAQANATFYNRYGIEEDIQLIWSSSNESVATVDMAGLVTGEGSGQANLTCSVGSTTSLPLLVTVVEDEQDVAQVSVSSPVGNQISIGQEVTLSVQVLNVLGDPIEGLEIEYTALDQEILSVNQNGVATGVANGFGRIIATVEGVQSNTLGIQVGQTSRTGTFSGANGYDAEGSTELFLADNGDLMLRLEDNFDTDFALGTFIYLSNSTSGSVTRNEGLEIQEVSSGGAYLFNVSSIDPTVTIDDFNYVIVLCKPATITFGYAQLN
ncbi:Ig-like domain-containing protein [Cryomorphaceae bacterium 1068]|nr:Ig-like domain-containing protein [Cryomorphaceae bacterium 1068]